MFNTSHTPIKSQCPHILAAWLPADPISYRDLHCLHPIPPLTLTVKPPSPSPSHFVCFWAISQFFSPLKSCQPVSQLSWSAFYDLNWLSSLLPNFSYSSSGSFQGSCWYPWWHSVAVTCMSPYLGPLISPAPLCALFPERAILLLWSAARIAFPLTSVIPSFLSDLFPCLLCPSSYPLTCSFHYFHLIRLRISHPISAHFLLLYLSFLV